MFCVLTPCFPPRQLCIPPSPLEEIVQDARERAERLLQSSAPVRILGESEFFDFLDDVLQAHDDDPVLGAALDEVAVEYRYALSGTARRCDSL